MNVARKKLPVQFGLYSPERAFRRLQHKGALQSRDLRLSCDDRRRLVTQPVRRIPIVVIPVGDDLAPRLGASQIALGPDRETRGGREVADAGQILGQIADAVFAVVYDDQL